MMNRIYCGLAAILLMQSCSNVKPLALYDKEDWPADGPLKGLGATSVYNEVISSEIWYTQNSSCINVSGETGTASSGANNMRIQWDKPGGGCDWVGMGIGWAGWSGKAGEPFQGYGCRHRAGPPRWIRPPPASCSGNPASGFQSWCSVCCDAALRSPSQIGWHHHRANRHDQPM